MCIYRGVCVRVCMYIYEFFVNGQKIEFTKHAFWALRSLL